MFVRRIAFYLTLALLISVFALPGVAADRQCVVLEGFTQWNCGPCAGWNPSETGLLEQMTRDTVVSVKYHGWWPGANNDPFYLWNQGENADRIDMYGVNGVPDMRLDGYLSPPRNVSTLRNQVRSEYAMDCPCTIDMVAVYDEDSPTVTVTGSVSAEESLVGLRLFVALITNHVEAPPAGSNGETEWFDIFRDMWPEAETGDILLNDAGQDHDFVATLDRESFWASDNLHVVAWVQDISGNRQIVQGAQTSVIEYYDMTSTTAAPAQSYVPSESGEHVYEVYVNNTGVLEDTYTVTLGGDWPAGWTYTVEAEGAPAHESNINMTVNGGTESIATVRINTNGHPGYIDFYVDVVSQNDLTENATHFFRIMSGIEILVVDDDDGDAYEQYFMDALEPYIENTNLVHGIWDLESDPLDNAHFADADVIVWLTGESFQDGQTLTPIDQLMLGDYLTAGGTLLLSGQGIGFDIRTDQFMSDYLHAQYLRNWPQGQTLVPVEGDPITDGLGASLDGGSGADNQGRQSALNPLDDMAIPIYTYQEQNNGETYNAALRVEGPAWPEGNFRVVYLGFGLESIADEQTREDLMGNSIEWLRGVLSTPDDERGINVPNTFSLGQNYPNPFNPETTIPFSLAERSIVTLTVYDVLGRQVTDLVSGAFAAGVHKVDWAPAELASGIYFYTIEAVAGDHTFRDTRKLVLMK